MNYSPMYKVLVLLALILSVVSCTPTESDIDIQATIAESVKATVEAMSSESSSNTPPLPKEFEEVDVAEFIEFSLLEKELLRADPLNGRFLDVIKFRFRYVNVSGQDLRAFTGIVTFNDIFNRQIKKLRITYDDPIMNGQEVVDDNKQFEPNEFIESDRRLMTTDTQDLRTTFETLSVILTDGTIIGDPGS